MGNKRRLRSMKPKRELCPERCPHLAKTSFAPPICKKYAEFLGNTIGIAVRFFQCLKDPMYEWEEQRSEGGGRSE